jgi:hypothetical protein
VLVTKDEMNIPFNPNTHQNNKCKGRAPQQHFKQLLERNNKYKSDEDEAGFKI